MLISATLIITSLINSNANIDYTDKMITMLNENSEIKVKDVFQFDFDRAYVFNDCYISGEGFSERYNLDISIDEVESGVQEYIRRIVFVDDNGDFVYEFQYDATQLNAYEEGMIIYPDTVIEKCNPSIDGAITFKLHSSEYY